MPLSIKEELDFLIVKAFSGDFFTILEDLDKLLLREDITLEEKLLAKSLKSEAIGGLTMLGLEYSYQDALDLSLEVMGDFDKIQDKSLQVFVLIILGFSYSYVSNWQKVQEVFLKYKPIFDELEPSKEHNYMRLKAQNYLYEGMLPFLKAYTGEDSTPEEKMKGFQLTVEGEKYCEVNDIQIYRISMNNNIATLQAYFGEADASLATRLELLELTKQLDNRWYYAYGLGNLADAYYTINNYKKFYDLHKERLVIVEELGFKPMIAKSYNNIGHYHLIAGDYDEALEYYYRGLKIYQELEREIGVAFNLQYCGYAFYLKGDLKKSLEYYDQAFPVMNKNKPQNWHHILSDLASIFMQTGELDKALEYLEQLLKIEEGLHDQHGISLALSEQGKIYWQKGMKEQGLDLIERSLEIRSKIGDKFREAASLYYLIRFNIELNNVNVAKKYFEDLDIINKEIDNKHVNQYHKFSEALILKSSHNNRDRIKAELLFEQLIEEEINYPVLVQVLLHLCELLLVDMRETSDTEVLKRISKYVNTLQDLSEKNDSYILLVETLGLKAQIELLEFDVESARSYLLNAQTIAQKNGLDKHVLTLLKQQEDLTKQSMELKKLEKSQSPISSRMSIVKLEDTVIKIQKTSLAKTVSREEVSKKLLSIQI